MEKIKLRSMVIVEGKYDKIKLDSILDAEIIETDGFSIFKNEQLKEYIRKTALERGIITATDSDGAGLLIRNYLSGIVPPDRIKHVLIPKIPGKESRKAEPSKEGTVGVEGIDADVLRSLFEPFKDETQPEYRKVTTVDLYNDGFSGKENSYEKRKRLCSVLKIPDNLSSKSIVKSINTSGGYPKYKAAIDALNDENK